MKKIFAVILCVVMVCGVLVGCASNSNSVVGEWQLVTNPDLNETWEFTETGEAIQRWSDKDVATFDYTIENDKIKVAFKDGTNILFEGIIAGNEITSENGATYKKK